MGTPALLRWSVTGEVRKEMYADVVVSSDYDILTAGELVGGGSAEWFVLDSCQFILSVSLFTPISKSCWLCKLLK